jgi:ferrochelatase
MRHWKPYIREAVDQIARGGFTRVTAVCMTPFFSQMSVGVYYDHLDNAFGIYPEDSAWRKNLTLRKIGAWYANKDFVRALADNLYDSLGKMNQKASPPKSPPVVLFSAHSLPVALTDQSDPYAEQFAQLCQLVAAEAGLEKERWQACFQSAGARNGRWLAPSLEENLHKLASQGVKSVLVAPIGFLCDHVEVLYDIDIEARGIAAQVGIELERTPSLNDHPAFISALANIICSGDGIS